VPILSSVLLVATGDRVRIVATDLGLGIACWLPAKVEDEGAIAVPYARLVAWMSGLSGPSRSGSKRKGTQQALPVPVTLEAALDAPSLTVCCGRRRATIPGNQAEDFPFPPSLEVGERPGNVMFELDLPLFCTMVEQVCVAADPRDASRPFGRLVLQATAGRVVLTAGNEGTRALCEGALSADFPGQLTLALPAQDTAKVARVLRGTGQGALQMVVEREQHHRVFFHTPEFDLVLPLYEHEPEIPAPDSLVPFVAAARVVVDREALAAALTFVAFVAKRNGTAAVDLLALSGGARLLVEARDRELGEQATEVEVARAESWERFRCAPTFGFLEQLVATAGGTSLSLEWQYEAGTLVLRSHQDAPSCLTTYVLLHTRAAASPGQGGRP